MGAIGRDGLYLASRATTADLLHPPGSRSGGGSILTEVPPAEILVCAQHDCEMNRAATSEY